MDLDARLDQVRRWAVKALLGLGAVGLLVLAVLAVLTVLWRWMLYSLRVVQRGVLDRFSDMYRWLDRYSPSESEEERSEKFATLRGRVSSLLASEYISWLPEWSQLDRLDWLLLVAVVMLVGVGLYGSIKLAGKVGRRSLMHLRGVQMEAMQPGSFFTPAKIPECQVQVCIPGLLYDAHQGYGTRVGSYLVTNAHVICGFPEVILRGVSGKKMLVTPSYVRSRLSEDLVYVYLGPSTFAQLGTKSAKGMKSFVSGFATCVGPSGASTGRVSKASIRGKLIYEGSTVPGMSGAPYLMQGAFVGVHQGAAGHSNLGISAEVVKAEMPRLVQTESVTGSSPMSHKAEDPAEQYQSKFKASWSFEDLDQIADSRYNDDSWAEFDEDESFWTRKLEFEAKAKALPAKSVMITQSDGSVVTVPMTLQNSGEKEEVLDLAKASDMDFLASLRTGKLVERVEALERELSALKDLVERPKQVGPQLPKEDSSPAAQAPSETRTRQGYPCSRCETVCRTETRLERHLQASHVSKESALAEDTGREGKLVKQAGSFLGKRASPTRSGKNSRNTSPVKGGKTQSRSLEENLQLMLESQRSTEMLLKRFLSVSAGPGLATMPK